MNLKNIFTVILLFSSSTVFSQVRQVTSFNPIYTFPDSGLFIVDGSFLGKKLLVSDADDGQNIDLTLLTPAQDSVAAYNISLNKFTLGSVLTFEFNDISDTVFIQSDGGVNGIVGNPGFPIVSDQTLVLRYTTVGWINDDRVFNVSSLSDIENVNARPGDVIKVTGLDPIAEFKVRSSGNSRYRNTAERVLKNGYIARVSRLSDGFHVNHFGATPEDSNADDFYIQEAINFVLSEDPLNGSVLNFGPGEYRVDTGIVMNRTISWANKKPIASFETLTLKGVGNGYGTFNSTSLVSTNDDSFIIGAQACRNCKVEGIVLQANNGLKGAMDKDTLLNYSRNELFTYFGKYVRTTENSPNAAIVIDPFSNGGATKYPLWTGAYDGSFAETSMFTIDGCSIAYTFIGVSINPGIINQNGDNVRLTNSHVTSVGVAWKSSTTQSRQNSIDNVYLTSCMTFVAGVGTPPSIRNINGAGIIRELFDINTGFGPIRMDNCYFEGMFSIGRIVSTHTVFNQCQFKFNQNIDESVHGLVAYNSGDPVFFNDCSIQYFSNATNPVPLVFDCGYVEARRCHIETGIWINHALPDGLYDRIRMYDSEFYAPFNKGSSAQDQQIRDADNNQQLTTMVQGWIGSGAWDVSDDGWNYGSTGNYPFRLFNVESGITVTKEVLNISGSDTLAFRWTTSEPGMYQINDNIISDINYTTHRGVSLNDMSLGRVVKIKNDTIWTSYGPYAEANSSYGGVTIYNVYPYYFTPPFWGDVTSGNDTIKNVYGYFPENNAKYFDQDFDDYFESGAYVVNHSEGGNWVVMSTLGKKNGSDIRFANQFGGVSTGSSNPGTGYIPKGAKWNFGGREGIDHLRCTKGGVFGSVTNEPEWGDTLWYNRIESLPQFVTNTVTGSTTDVDLNSKLLTYVYLELSSAPDTITMNVTEAVPGAEMRLTCANPVDSVLVNFSFSDSDGTTRSSFISNTTTAKDVNISFVNINPTAGAAIWVTNDL